MSRNLVSEHQLNCRSPSHKDCLTPTVKARRPLSFIGLCKSSFKFSSCCGNDEYGSVCLRGSRDHVLDEISICRSINEKEIAGLELPEININGDSSFSLSLQLIQAVKHTG